MEIHTDSAQDRIESVALSALEPVAVYAVLSFQVFDAPGSIAPRRFIQRHRLLAVRPRRRLSTAPAQCSQAVLRGIRVDTSWFEKAIQKKDCHCLSWVVRRMG